MNVSLSLLCLAHKFLSGDTLIFESLQTLLPLLILLPMTSKLKILAMLKTLWLKSLKKDDTMRVYCQPQTARANQYVYIELDPQKHLITLR